MNYIELFAGCGGLSLGLKSIGFELVMANELSPMAAESYAYNFYDEDLQEAASAPLATRRRTLWLSSQFSESELKSRLRENPQQFPPLGTGHTDLASSGENLPGSLVVGSIVDLNTWLEANPLVAQQLRKGFGAGGVDLVSGGPPCQSFSMAGLRRKDCEKNSLPWEFAKFARLVQPRLVLLENVTGILRAFKDDQGNKYFAWFELAKAFAAIGYIPLCLHVNAKYAGVPQNRPRFILLGVRQDFYGEISPTFNGAERTLFAQPLEFFLRAQVGEELGLDRLAYRDISRKVDLDLFHDSFLSTLVKQGKNFVSVKQAIDDLKDEGATRGAFATHLSNTFGSVLSSKPMGNHVLRGNSDHVQRRFRIYQAIKQVPSDTQKRVIAILKGNDEQLAAEDMDCLSAVDFVGENMQLTRFQEKQELEEYLRRHVTKKQTQKALSADQPAPAALSIPDDACHYDPTQLRTLTVREMARIQSFPDEFQFRSKVTTGGTSRRYEVPQYTQVGNAVPPLLGRALGLAISGLLSRAGKAATRESTQGQEA